MDYEYATSECYDFIERPRAYEATTAKVPPAILAFFLSLPLWALLLGGAYGLVVLVTR